VIVGETIGGKVDIAETGGGNLNKVMEPLPWTLWHPGKMHKRGGDITS